MNIATRAHNANLSAANPSDRRWVRLRDLIQEHSLMRGDFTLSSGRKSDYFFQLRQTTMLPEGQYLLGHLIVEFMRTHNLKCVGGLELGAVPVVVAASFASYLLDYPVNAFFVRKEAKQHGARERIDGWLPEDSEALIVDDVTTTGGSMLRAVECVRDERNCRVNLALSIVDREEPEDTAVDRLAARGIQLVSIFKRSDFIRNE